MEGQQPKWNPVFSDFMASIGVAPRVCKPYRYRWRIAKRVIFRLDSAKIAGTLHL